MSSLTSAAPRPADGRADFDFFWGRWRVRHRRLRTRLAGGDHWDSFDGTCETRPILNGLGNMDDNVLDLPGGVYYATTVRLFDQKTRMWSIWWIDSRNPAIESPVHGQFQNGVGTFYGDETLDGRPIRVRFLWSRITPMTARWEQAFSADAGENWETNWSMEFERVP